MYDFNQAAPQPMQSPVNQGQSNGDNWKTAIHWINVDLPDGTRNPDGTPHYAKLGSIMLDKRKPEHVELARQLESGEVTIEQLLAVARVTHRSNERESRTYDFTAAQEQAQTKAS